MRLAPKGVSSRIGGEYVCKGRDTNEDETGTKTRGQKEGRGKVNPRGDRRRESDGKCCGVEITETCVREGPEAGVKGAQNARISQRRFREWDARDDFSVGILPDSEVGVILRASGV